MNTPERPLSPETLDELLSADIDGELDRAATDLGLTPEQARAALETAPGAAARRAALVRARDLLAVSPPLAPGIELGLAEAVASAGDVRDLRAARRRRDRLERGWRVLVTTGSAAAVLAGVVALVASNHGGESKSSNAPLNVAASAPERGTPKAAPLRLTVAFGDVSDSTTLIAKVQRRLARPATTPVPATTTYGVSTPATVAPDDNVANSGSGAAGPPGTPGPGADEGIQGPGGATGLPGPQGLQGDEGVQAGAQHKTLGAIGPTGPQNPTGTLNQGLSVTTPPLGRGTYTGSSADTTKRAAAKSARTLEACIATTQHVEGLGSPPVVAGTGTVNQRPVFVVVFRLPTSVEVFVLSATNCSVVTHETLH